MKAIIVYYYYMVPFMVWSWCCVEPPGEKKLTDLEDIPEICYAVHKYFFFKLPRYPARGLGYHNNTIIILYSKSNTAYRYINTPKKSNYI